MADYDFKKFDDKTAAAKEWLAREYRGLRTGRASPSVLDGVSVSAYGTQMPLKQVAGISIEDPRTIRVQPFDAGLVKDIERAITAANLSLGVSADSRGVGVSFADVSGGGRGVKEEDKFTLKEELQKKVDKANEALEKAFEGKEKEMTN